MLNRHTRLAITRKFPSILQRLVSKSPFLSSAPVSASSCLGVPASIPQSDHIPQPSQSYQSESLLVKHYRLIRFRRQIKQSFILSQGGTSAIRWEHAHIPTQQGLALTSISPSTPRKVMVGHGQVRCLVEQDKAGNGQATQPELHCKQKTRSSCGTLKAEISW